MAPTNTKTLLTVKTDKQLKDEAQDLAEHLGLALGTVVNSLLRQFVRDKGLNLSAEETYIPNKRTSKVLNKAHKDFLAGKNISPSFDNAEDLIAYLRSQK